MDPSRFASLSSLDRSRHAVRRLLGVYLPAFDDIRAFAGATAGHPFLVGQRDVTGTWRAILGSAVVAISWDVLQGLDVVMVLLDDPEFGRDIKWFISPAAVSAVDFKLLLVHVETSMEIMMHVVKDPSILSRVEQAPVVDVPVVVRDPGRIRSPSFCLAVESGNVIPNQLEQYAGPAARWSENPVLHEAFVPGGSFKAPLFCWRVLAGLRSCVARDAACMGGLLHVRIDKAILADDPFSKSIMLLIKVQLEAICAVMLSALDPLDRSKQA